MIDFFHPFILHTSHPPLRRIQQSRKRSERPILRSVCMHASLADLHFRCRKHTISAPPNASIVHSLAIRVQGEIYREALCESVYSLNAPLDTPHQCTRPAGTHLPGVFSSRRHTSVEYPGWPIYGLLCILTRGQCFLRCWDSRKREPHGRLLSSCGGGVEVQAASTPSTNENIRLSKREHSESNEHVHWADSCLGRQSSRKRVSQSSLLPQRQYHHRDPPTTEI